MPAVQQVRLKAQLNELTWQFTRPVDFQRVLKNLFELYADRVYRAGHGVPAVKFILAYHLPPIIIRQLELELAHSCLENPVAAMAIADVLWTDAYLEPRQFAAFILGQVPVDPPDAVIERLLNWCQPHSDRLSLNSALTKGCYRLRRDAPQRWLALMENWLDQQKAPYQIMVLQALLPAIEDRDFVNLPPLFQIATPIIKSAPLSVQSELLEVINAFAKRSPVETAYILRQVVSTSTRPATARLIRKSLPMFDLPTQEKLRAAFSSLSLEESDDHF